MEQNLRDGQLGGGGGGRPTPPPDPFPLATGQACEEIIDSGNSGRKEAEHPVTVVQGTKESIPDEEHLRRKERRERKMKAKAVAAAASTAVKKQDLGLTQKIYRLSLTIPL